ncbi:MAG: hypothetical protein LBB56_04805 [Chitinispirillales bacterium]|jgi:hypothetical protein|nr:hypothetical protein [Chitinispirillales bacterium]
MEPVRAYNYFNRSPEIELAAFLLFAPVLVTLWVFSFYYFYLSGAISLPIMKSSVYFTVFLIFSHIFYRNWRVNSKFKAVIIEEERILKKSAAGVRSVLNFADVKEIRAFIIPYIQEWIILKSSQKSMSVPLSVHGGRDMAERIFNNIKRSAEGTIEGYALKEKLKNEARRANIVQNLRVKQIPVLINVIGAAAIFNCGVALIFWESTVLEILIWGCASMLFPLGAYFLTEKIHLKNLLGNIDGKPKKDFTRNYLFAGFCGFMVSMAAAFFC